MPRLGFHRAIGRWGFPEFVVVIASIMALNPLAMDMMLPALPNIASAFHITIANRPQAVLSTFLIGFGVGQFVMDRFQTVSAGAQS
jgi:MFS transporter, DHA1 family, multidrug resistance protein